MIIKKVEINNFQCYFRKNTFEFKDGLNIILGANAHGKSKFFDAVYWLFNGEVIIDGSGFFQKELLISKKELSKIEEDDVRQVAVSIELNRNGEDYFIQRSFTFTKQENNLPKIGKDEFIIEYTLSNGERIQRRDEQFLEIIFPSAIRKYSLFKGEHSLKVFDPNNNPDALKNLVNALTKFKSFDTYVEIGKNAKDAAIKSIERIASKSIKDNTRLNRELKERDYYRVKVDKCSKSIKQLSEEIDRVKLLQEKDCSYLEISEEIEILNKKLKNYNSELNQIDAIINNTSNFNVTLFDDFWILRDFSGIRKVFNKKYNAFEKERRRIEQEFEREKGKKEGKKEILQHLTDTPLPIGVPDERHLEEMLKEEICKVCNRKAPKDSEAYLYMQERLTRFIKTLNPEIENNGEEEVVAFKNSFEQELNDLNKLLQRKLPQIHAVKKSIEETFLFLEKRRERRQTIQTKIDELENEKSRILSSSTAGEKSLLDIAQSLKNYTHDLSVYENQKVSLELELVGLKDNLEEHEKQVSSISINEVPSYLLEKKDIIIDMFKVFKDTRERKFVELINEIEELTNQYYLQLGAASGGYTGQIRITKLSNDNINVYVKDKITDENITHTLSGSTVTSIYLAILMAISSIASKRYSDSFPVIFDAPISDFDNAKSKEFFELARNTFGQSIVLIKNYIVEEVPNSKRYLIQKDFYDINPQQAYWVKLPADIDPEAMETIESQIEKLN